MMLDSNRRSLHYHNENGLVLDPQAENKDAMLRVQYWSLAEIETFKERYLAHPKNFGYIANALDNKVCQYLVLNTLPNYTPKSVLDGSRSWPSWFKYCP